MEFKMRKQHSQADQWNGQGDEDRQRNSDKNRHQQHDCSYVNKELLQREGTYDFVFNGDELGNLVAHGVFVIPAVASSFAKASDDKKAMAGRRD